MKALVLSCSDVIHTSFLKHLANEDLVHLIDGSQPLAGAGNFCWLEITRLSSSYCSLGKTFLHKHLPKSCDLILPDPTPVSYYFDNLNT